MSNDLTLVNGLSSRHLWLIVFVATTILWVTSGIRLSLGLLVQPIIHSSTLDIKQISFALAITQLMWGVSQPVTGVLAHKFGAWWVLCLGMILLAVGCLAAS